MYGYVLAEGYWCNIILHCNQGGAGTVVTVNIGSSQGNGIRPNIGTIKGFGIYSQVVKPAGVARAIVHLSGREAAGAIGIQLNSHVLAQGFRGYIIFYGNR